MNRLTLTPVGLGSAVHEFLILDALENVGSAGNVVRLRLIAPAEGDAEIGVLTVARDEVITLADNDGRLEQLRDSCNALAVRNDALQADHNSAIVSAAGATKIAAARGGALDQITDLTRRLLAGPAASGQPNHASGDAVELAEAIEAVIAAVTPKGA